MPLADIRELVYAKRPLLPILWSGGGVANPSAAQLAAIEREADAANDLVSARRYQDAVHAYHALRAKVWSLIGGGSAPGGGIGVKWRPPHRPGDLDKFLDASSKLLGRLPAEKAQATVLGGALDSGEFGRTALLGLRLQGDLVSGADEARAGVDAALEGRLEEATARLNAALGSAGDDPARKAAIQLNLGAVALQAGKTDEAEAALRAARAGFEAAGDKLGLAQTDQNLAVLAASRGQADAAKGLFEAAERNVGEATGGLGRAVNVLHSIGRPQTGTTGAPAAANLAGADVLRAAALRPGLTRATALRPGVTLSRGAGEVADLTLERVADLAAERAAETARPASGTGADGAAGAGSLADVGRGIGVVFRDPAASTLFYTKPLMPELAATQKTAVSAGFLVGDEVRRVDWTGDGPGGTVLATQLYEPRLAATTLAGLYWPVVALTDTAARLGHIYYYETALGLGDAYAGLESWAAARSWYAKAADYLYLNAAIEAPLLWQRIARTHLGEGDERYRRDDLDGAKAAYGAVLKPDLSAPTDSALYTHAALKATGALVATLLANPQAPPAELGAGLAATVLDIAQRMAQLAGGLDWFGVPVNYVPPFTFDYLQQAARFLAQQAQLAERDYLQFAERFDSSTLTRLQLQQAASSAAAEATVVRAQRDAARAEITVAQQAKALADLRTANAKSARDAYSAMANEQIALETSIAWYTSQNSWELENRIRGRGPDAGRRIHEVVADKRQRLGQISRDYELKRMDQNRAELQAAAAQAQAQVAAMQARANAAEWAVRAADLRANQAQELADAFEESTFTPEVWAQLAEFMRRHAARYLEWATRVARLMERAYEFEQDRRIDRILTDYSTGTIQGLLGADRLLGDIDFFTYDRVMRTDYRPQRAALRLSLAERFPFAFQTEFRRTGRMSFELSLADVEALHPGSFNHRVQAVEVEVVGVVPPGGLHGTLANGGVSQFRARDGSVKWRVQAAETQILSAHERPDLALFRQRPELLGVFEGAGLASTWTLSFPPASNDIDFAFVVDVELVFHFEAGFDQTLAEQRAAEPLPPEATRASSAFSLRWDLPDRFFLLQSGGETTLPIGPEHLPRHHLAPKVRSVALQLLGPDGPAEAGIAVSVGAPGKPVTDAASNAEGRVPAADLAGLAGGPVVGEWPIKLGGTPAERAAIYDALLFVEYDYEARAPA